jgi:hypothetical protein
MRRQTMMHMQGAETGAQAKLAEQVQQDDGIAATGKADAHGLVRRQAVTDKGGEPRRQVRRRPVP